MGNLFLEARLIESTSPAFEPLSVADAKKHLEIADSDVAHDSHIEDLIQAAREQFEHDADTSTSSRSYQFILDGFPIHSERIRLPIRPVTALTSITYKDSADTDTLATTVADLDTAKKYVALKYDQSWPSIEKQNDAVIIQFVAGYASAAAVPRMMRQAMLLLIGKWFEDREMAYSMPADQADQAYERLLYRLRRASYP